MYKKFIRHSSVLRHLDNIPLSMKAYMTKLLSNMQNNWKNKEPLWYPS